MLHSYVAKEIPVGSILINYHNIAVNPKNNSIKNRFQYHKLSQIPNESPSESHETIVVTERPSPWSSLEEDLGVPDRPDFMGGWNLEKVGNGGFQKWGYPQIIYFCGIFHSNHPAFKGTFIFRKPPKKVG